MNQPGQPPSTQPVAPASTRWAELAGPASGAEYAARFARLAASGQNPHGEADFCAALVPAPASVLDAGCGTGRVAMRLAELGYRTVGADLDDSMLAEARRARPDLTWLHADLATLPDLATWPAAGFDLVVAAGNVVALLAPGTLGKTVRRLAAVLAPGGLLVAGFGLDQAHLPARCPMTPAADYHTACADAGLSPVRQHGGWDGADQPAGYLVAVHRKPA